MSNSYRRQKVQFDDDEYTPRQIRDRRKAEQQIRKLRGSKRQLANNVFLVDDGDDDE